MRFRRICCQARFRCSTTVAAGPTAIVRRARLTYMADGKKHVLYIPKHLVQEVRQKVEAGRAYQDAVREVLAANAKLLTLARKQRLI